MATVSLYPLSVNLAGQPISLPSATANGGNVIEAQASLPSGFGYRNDTGNGGGLFLPPVAMGDIGDGDWTLEFWVHGSNWNALSAVQRGIMVFTATEDNTFLRVTTESTSDRFIAFATTSEGNSVTFNTTLFAVNGATHFFSVTREGTDIHFHIDGTLYNTETVPASDTFNFNPPTGDKFLEYMSERNATSACQGWIGDIRFSSEALYSSGNYTPPTDPLEGPSARRQGYFMMG